MLISQQSVYQQSTFIPHHNLCRETTLKRRTFSYWEDRTVSVNSYIYWLFCVVVTKMRLLVLGLLKYKRRISKKIPLSLTIKKGIFPVGYAS